MSAQASQRVVVTGGCGYIGTVLVQRLVALGHDVTVVDNLSSGRAENIKSLCEVQKVDVADWKKIQKCIEKIKPEVVFHLAGQKFVPRSIVDPIQDAHHNVLGSLHVLEAMRSIGGGRVVFASTAAVYNSEARLPIKEEAKNVGPVSPYGVSKRAAELYMWTYSNLFPLAAISFRFANAYGPGGRSTAPEKTVLDWFIPAVLRGEPVTVYGTGEQTRDFVFVDDVVDACIRAMRVSWCGEMNISSNTSTSINHVIQMLERIVDRPIQVQRQDARDGEIFQSRLDNTLAAEVMGWKPKTSFEDGLKKTVEWYRQIQS